MTSYATSAEMVSQYGTAEMVLISNPDNANALTVNATAVDLALTDATAEINTYLLRKGIDLVQTPLLNRLCRVIARKNMKFDAPAQTEKPQWRYDYEDAIKILESMDLADGATQPAVLVSGNARALSRSTLSGW